MSLGFANAAVYSQCACFQSGGIPNGYHKWGKTHLLYSSCVLWVELAVLNQHCFILFSIHHPGIIALFLPDLCWSPLFSPINQFFHVQLFELFLRILTLYNMERIMIARLCSLVIAFIVLTLTSKATGFLKQHNYHLWRWSRACYYVMLC